MNLLMVFHLYTFPLAYTKQQQIVNSEETFIISPNSMKYPELLNINSITFISSEVSYQKMSSKKKEYIHAQTYTCTYANYIIKNDL